MKAMFKKRLLKLADVIEGTSKRPLVDGKPIRFNMDQYVKKTECGTAACIAGTAAFMADPHNAVEWTASEIARGWLGLDREQATLLFLPHDYKGPSWSSITPRRAVAVLRHFAETGEIKWNMKLS